MKQIIIANLKNCFRAVLFIVLLNTIGCAGKADLIKAGKYSAEELNTVEVDIDELAAHIEDSKFIVTGRLKRFLLSSYLPGHVDVAIFSSNGNLLNWTSVTHSIPFITYKRRVSYFKAKFQRIPPEGSLVSASFHKEELSEDLEFDCGANKAVLDKDRDPIK